MNLHRRVPATLLALSCACALAAGESEPSAIDQVEPKGPGRLLLEAKRGRWVATALEVDAAPAAPAAPAPAAK